MRFLSKLVKPIGCRLRLASLSEFDLWERGDLLLAENDYALVDSTQLRIRIRTDPSLADLNQMTLGIEDSFLVALVIDLEDPRFMTYAQWKNIARIRALNITSTPPAVRSL